MPGPALRHGRVVDADGAPVGGALVWVEESDVPVPELAIACDGAGRFRVALPAGRYVLAASAPDGAAGRLACSLAPEPGGPLVIRLDERPR